MSVALRGCGAEHWGWRLFCVQLSDGQGEEAVCEAAESSDARRRGWGGRSQPGSQGSTLNVQRLFPVSLIGGSRDVVVFSAASTTFCKDLQSTGLQLPHQEEMLFVSWLLIVP